MRPTTSVPDTLPRLAPRLETSHKGDFGKALLVGGSTGMSGAIGMAGIATLRSGAGLVTVATPFSVAPIVSGLEPSYMTLPLPEHDGRISGKALQTLLNIADTSNALAVGPGLGRSRSLDRMVSRLYRKADCPSVFDADALHALAQSPRKLAYAPADGNKQRIITPHMGEFRRLVDQPDLQRPAAIDLAREIAKRYRIVVVLKGAGTVVCSETDQFVNTTGNPGLATGGTGDVLTGILCGLLAQKLPAFQAAVAGVYLHGLAADLAVKDLGETAMIASDLLAYLPQAIQRYTQTTIQPNHLHPPNQQPRKSP